MQNNPMMNFALNLIQQNPALQNNPNAKEMIEVIRSGDTAKDLRAMMEDADPARREQLKKDIQRLMQEM